jgi:hypothetical protein
MESTERNIIRLCIFLLCLLTFGLAKDDSNRSLAKPSTLEFVLFTGNNIRNWMGNNGHLSSHMPTGDAGAEWPAGSGKTAIFSAGIWVVGQVNGELRSVAAEYTSEWTPGTIPYNTQTLQPTSDIPNNTTDHQIYFIRNSDSADPSSDNYNAEYARWPASEGAPAHDGEYFTDQNHNGVWDSGEPFEDFNLNGIYDSPDDEFVTGEDPPEFKGDEQAWWVMNGWGNEARNHLWRTPSLGVEAHVLVYNRSDDPIYENIQFRTVTLINKGGNYMDSTYFSIWSDVDLGDATDDAGGCDSSLSLAYVYNGRPFDQDYALRPPAVGYSFLQGPLINSPGDSVVYGGQPFPNQRALDMNAFILILKYNPFSDPETVHEAYNMVQGLTPDSGSPIIDPWGNITTFHVSGDPVTDNGWTATNSYSNGDRRILMSTGPFDMPPWDDLNDNGKPDFGEPGVQIIHTALLIVAGADNLDAITSLKYATKKVRSDFEFDFESPQLDPPQFSASANDQEIVLNWHAGAEAYEKAINFGYEFEGYNLYQGSSARGPWTRLHTFDVVNGVGRIVEAQMDDLGFISNQMVQFGDDTGLQHLLSINEDVLNEDMPLVNNKLYHFAISAYAYDAGRLPKSIESTKQIVSIRPHQTYAMAGVRDTLELEHIGLSDVCVTVDVLDPGQLTGLNYKLGFDYDSTQAKARWYVTRRAVSFEDTALLSDWHGLDWYTDRLFAGESLYLDGFELSLGELSFSRPRLNHSWQQTSNLEGTTIDSLTLKAVSPGAVDSLFYDVTDGQLVHLDTLVGHDYYYDYYRVEERSDGTYYILFHLNMHDVYIQAFASNFGAIGGDRIADIPGVGGGSEDINFLQSDLEIRFTENGQKATRFKRQSIDTLITVPFEVWDTERNIQLCVGIKDNNKSGGIQDTSLTDWENTLDLDWVIVFDRDYETYADNLQPFYDNPYSGWAWQFWDESRFSIGDVLQLHFVNPINAEVESFHWTTDVAGASYDEDALDQIQVFPNPYFGYHSDQTNVSGPFVTFSNLPEQECIIRIYTLGGQLVKRIDHMAGSYENWNLLNEHNQVVASGIYLVHIEVPELGNKILKLAILQPER